MEREFKSTVKNKWAFFKHKQLFRTPAYQKIFLLHKAKSLLWPSSFQLDFNMEPPPLQPPLLIRSNLHCISTWNITNICNILQMSSTPNHCIIMMHLFRVRNAVHMKCFSYIKYCTPNQFWSGLTAENPIPLQTPLYYNCTPLQRQDKTIKYFPFVLLWQSLW